MLRRYQGGCHCGAVRFAVSVDISAGTIKCNCSVCAKMRLWSVRARPADFELLAGRDELTDYRFGSGVANHTFCRRCGIHAFERVDLPPPRTSYYNIALMCLEGVDIAELKAAPVTFVDGAKNDWGSVPRETWYL